MVGGDERRDGRALESGGNDWRAGGGRQHRAERISLQVFLSY